MNIDPSYEGSSDKIPEELHSLLFDITSRSLTEEVTVRDLRDIQKDLEGLVHLSMALREFKMSIEVRDAQRGGPEAKKKGEGPHSVGDQMTRALKERLDRATKKIVIEPNEGEVRRAREDLRKVIREAKEKMEAADRASEP